MSSYASLKYDLTQAAEEFVYDIINKLKDIRTDCEDDHFTKAEIAEELEDLLKEIGE